MSYSVLGETVSSLSPTPENCDLNGLVEHCNCHLYVLRPLDLEKRGLPLPQPLPLFADLENCRHGCCSCSDCWEPLWWPRLS